MDPTCDGPCNATVTLHLAGHGRATPKSAGSMSIAPMTSVVTGKRKARAIDSWRCTRCKQVDMDMFMVGCDLCDRWFHGACCGISEDRAAAISTWMCPACEDGEDAIVRQVVDRLIARVERDELKAAKHDARVDSEVRRVVGRLIATIERADGRPNDGAPSSRSTARVQTSSKPAAPLLGPTIVRPAADGSYRYERHAAQTKAAANMVEGGNDVTVTVAASAVPATAAPTLFALLTPDCLEAVFAMLPLPALLLSAVPTCHRFAALAEPVFAAHATALGVKPARRARGAATAMQHPWRQLLRANACAVCLAPSPNFPARRPTSDRYGAIVCKLCMTCARSVEVQRRAQRRGLEIDSIGMDGKALFTRQCSVPAGGARAGFRQDELLRGSHG